jgi:hypothetical protein
MKRFIILLAVIMSSFIMTSFHITTNAYTHSQLRQLARDSARHYEVDVGLVFAIIQQESGWQHDVVSHAGARGVMQIMPATGRSACDLTKEELFEAEKNIDCGVRYFSKQLMRFRSEQLALCAYNAGPNRAKKGLKRCNRIKETKHYMRNIMAIWGGGKRYEEVPEDFVSAKAIADNWFIYDDYYTLPSQWWKLVCQAVDEVYYKKHGKKEPAKRLKERALWASVLNATADDIYQDTKRFKQGWSEEQIKSKIKGSCPKFELSAKKLADKAFKKGADQSPKMWWKSLCKAIDQVYVKKRGFGRSSKDSIWSKIVNETVDDIYADEVKKGEEAWTREKIKKKIKTVCR